MFFFVFVFILFFCNIWIFKINLNLAVRERFHAEFNLFVIGKGRTKIEIIEKKERNHFELGDIEIFLRLNEYPKTTENFKNLSIENRQFLYKRQRFVVMEKEQQLEKIKDVPEGAGQSTHSKAMARYSTYP